MLSKNIKFKNFKGKKINKTLKIFLKNLIDKKDDKNNLINSFTTSYLYSFNKKKIKCSRPSNVQRISKCSIRIGGQKPWNPSPGSQNQGQPA